MHHDTTPVRVPARRAFSAAVGDAEQQPLVGFNSFLARPGFRSRAYVSGPSAGGGAKVAPMTQGGTQDETSPGGGAG